MRNEEKELLETFHLFDQTKNGFISQSELQDGLQNLTGVVVSWNEIQHMWIEILGLFDF